MCEINELLKLTDESKIIGALQELEQNRKTKLKPAIKFLKNTPHEQWGRIHKEFEEALTELIKYNIEINRLNSNIKQTKLKLLDELNDIQICVETLKAIIEPDENKRMESMIRTVDKNDVRYYYCS